MNSLHTSNIWKIKIYKNTFYSSIKTEYLEINLMKDKKNSYPENFMCKHY